MTLYGYARVSVREPEDKNLDLQDGPAAPLAFVSPAGQTARTRHLLWPAGHGTSCGLQDTQVRIDFLPVLVAALRSCSPELNGPCYRLLTSRFCVTLTDVKVRLNRFLRTSALVMATLMLLLLAACDRRAEPVSTPSPTLGTIVPT